MTWHPNSNKHKATHNGYKQKPTQGQIKALMEMYDEPKPKTPNKTISNNQLKLL